MTPTLGGLQLWTDRRWRSGWRVQQLVGTSTHRVLNERDQAIAIGSLSRCLDAWERAPDFRAERVIFLVHGLGRTARAMRPLEDHLEGLGWACARLTYASTRSTIQSHTAAFTELFDHLPPAMSVSFVTHSLGGIVCRGALARTEHASLGRLVMLAPPSRGSSLARLLSQRVPAVSWVLGASARELAAAATGGLAIPPPAIPACVIAGQGRGDGVINPLIQGPNDGIVSVAETRLEGAAHHIVRAIHTTIMNDKKAREIAVDFLAGA